MVGQLGQDTIALAQRVSYFILKMGEAPGNSSLIGSFPAPVLLIFSSPILKMAGLQDVVEIFFTQMTVVVHGSCN